MAKYSKPKKITKENSKNGFQQFVTYYLEMMTAIYVFILMAVYPLFYHDKYFDMGDSKFAFFQTVSFVFIGSLLVGSIMWIIANYKSESFINVIKNFNITDWLAIIYLVSCYISFLFSDDKKMAFEGFNGWNMGLVSQVIFVLLYFYVSRCWKWSPTTLIAGLIAAFIAFFLAVIMRFGFDPLGMYERLSLVDVEKFVSTIGQTTWYSSYAVLLFPLGVYYYINVNKKWIKIFSSVFILFGAMSLCTVNSDSGYIAYLFIMLVFFWFSFDSNDKFIGFLDVASIILIGCKLTGILQDLFPDRLVVLVTGDEKISKFVTHNIVMLILMIVVIGLDILMRYFRKRDDDNNVKSPTIDIKKFKILRKIAVYTVIAGIWAGVLLIILTTNHKLPAYLNKLYDISFFKFDEIWGNCRGFNWTAAIVAFKSGSIKDMLVGVGPDCFDVAMTKYYAEEVARFWNGLHLACAHNEFLNLLVTGGIIGLVSYVGVMLSSVVRCAKVAVKEPAAVFVIAVVFSYIGHNFFCYQQCICTPYLFLFIGMGEVIIRATKENSNNK